METKYVNHGCIKCNHTDVVKKQVAMTSGGLGRMIDIQSNQFTAVSCTNCGYTEFYKTTGNRGMDILDLFFGS